MHAGQDRCSPQPESKTRNLFRKPMPRRNRRVVNAVANDDTVENPTLAAQVVTAIVYPFRRPAPPAPKRPMGFFTDTTLCIGCKACEVACKQWNQIPADGFNWTGNSYDNTVALSATTWRHVTFIEQFPHG